MKTTTKIHLITVIIIKISVILLIVCKPSDVEDLRNIKAEIKQSEKVKEKRVTKPNKQDDMNAILK